MKLKLRNNGSVLIMVVFLTAMLATLVMGILQMNTEELVLIRHRTFAAQAQALAMGGLNKAMAEIRNDPNWRAELAVELGDLDDDDDDDDWGSVRSSATTLGGGFYDTGFDGSTLTIVAGVEDWNGYYATIEADVTVGSTSPYVIRIDNLKINGY